MQRNETENFRDYQARRAAANLAVKNLNRPVPTVAPVPNYHPRRSLPFHTGIKGMASSRNTPFGAGLAASQAARNLTKARRDKHSAHLVRMKSRKEARAGASLALLLAA